MGTRLLRQMGFWGLCGIAASRCAATEEVLFDWEKAGDRAGWNEPGEKYRAEYGMLKAPAQSTTKASSGSGSLQVTLDTAGNDGAAPTSRGRLDRFYGGKADWSAFATLSAMLLVPEGAPKVEAFLVVQTGNGWKWQQGRPAVCAPGTWTKLTLDLRALDDIGQVQMLYVVAQCATAGFSGALHIDHVALDGDSGRPAPRHASEAGLAPTGDPGTWVETFDNAAGWESQGGARIGMAEKAAVGAGAITLNTPGSVTRTVKGLAPRIPDALDEGYAGASFWVKGDGSDNYGTIVLCGAHPQWFPFRYATAFPLNDTEWKRIVVPWRDWIPEDPAYPVGTPGGAPPSNIQYLKIGSKWTITHNNAKLPAFSYSLDQLQLEVEAPAPTAVPPLAPIDGVRAKLAAKQPVQVLCLGDSITAGTSLAKPDDERYARVLEGLLRQRYGYEGVSVVSRAVGGAQANDLRLWAQRDFTGVSPDLTILMVGYNDKTWGVSRDYYAYALGDYLDRVAVQTGGKTAVLLLTPTPGRGARFVMMDDYADAVRTVASTRKIALCDMHRAFKSLGRTDLDAYFADQAHPNAKGHRKMAEILADALSPLPAPRSGE